MQVPTGQEAGVVRPDGVRMYSPKPLPMTVEQIDRALEEWRNRLRLAMDNLLALDDNLTYKRLEGKDGLQQTPLTGLTQARVAPGLAAMHELFQQINRLSDVIDRATELRKALPRFFPSDNSLREIDQLLNGPSIQLPSRLTPLAQRSLVSAPETAQAITPSVLLEQMANSFEVARAAITAVDTAWSRLEPALGECETQAIALLRRARDLGEADAPDLIAVRDRVAALRKRIESDPLGVTSDFNTEVRPLLENASARLNESERQRDRIQSDLAQARKLLEQLNALHRQTVEALDQCRQQVADPTGLLAPLDAASLEELNPWLGTLEDAASQGRWRAARIGLDRWLKTAGEYAEAERTACRANQAPIELRNELKGRLSALKAKAQARGLTQDPTLSALAQQADSLLRQTPTQLALASQRVREYESCCAQIQTQKRS